jgi:hypothetical protein
MTGNGRGRGTRNVRHRGAQGAHDLVRRRHPVGVNEGMRGVCDGRRGSGGAFASVARFGRRRPGSSPPSASSSARKAAHVSSSTPRTSGRRDLGSAGYGWAPVKRRRRPVAEGGVFARILDSLIDRDRKTTRGPRLGRLFMRVIAMTTRGEGRARPSFARPVSRTPQRPPWRSSRARSSCHSWRSSY